MTEKSTLVIEFTLGDTLRKARLRAGLDQAELAARIAASRNTISNYENDHFGPRGPKVMTVRAWADACGVSRDEVEALVRRQGLEPAYAHRASSVSYGQLMSSTRVATREYLLTDNSAAA